MPKGTLYKLPIQVTVFENEANFQDQDSLLDFDVWKVDKSWKL